MRYVRMMTAMLFAPIAAAACADTLTTPDSAPAAAAGAPSRDYLLDPVIVIGTPQTPTPACDPYTDINFCQSQDDQCMTGVSPALGDFVAITGCPGMVGGSGGPGGDDSPLPGDTNNNGTTEDEGPGVWILCISSVLGVVAGGGASYFAVEDYFYKLRKLRTARHIEAYVIETYGTSSPEYGRVLTDVQNAETEARIAGGLAAGGIGVSIAALIGAGVLCAPLLPAPTL